MRAKLREMLRALVLGSGIGVVALIASCSLFTSVDGLQSGSDGGKDATTDASSIDAGTDSNAPLIDSGSDAASCSCTNVVSAYTFSDPAHLGADLLSKNDMNTVSGSPKQSAVTPNGLPGFSIALDGASTVCIASGFTFDSTQDHTLCWWAEPAALAGDTDLFAQQCGYDTWTSTGTDYLWHINNCNNGTQGDLDVPNAFAVGEWVQICQTYSFSSLTRAVTLNGDKSTKTSVIDTAPILEDSNANWCIGSYGSGGYWTGLIYRPIWFNRVLSDDEIQAVSTNACCFQ